MLILPTNTKRMILIPMIDRIIQRTNHSCGVACAAMLLNIPYEDSEALFIAAGLHERRKPFASKVNELGGVLVASGAKLKRQFFRDWDTLITPCIAKSRVQANGDWHWVIIDRDPERGLYVIDPWPACDKPSYEHPPLDVTCIPLEYYRPKGSCISIHA